MTSEHYLVYQYMVSIFGGNSFSSLQELENAVMNKSATMRFIPSRTWGMYNIDTKEIISKGYLCRYGFDLIKVSNNKVVEYYRRLLANKDWCFIAYNLEDMTPKEAYRNVENKLCKYDWKTKELLQSNINCSNETLPNDYKSLISDFEYQDSVFMCASKPYGKVVEFYYPKQN